MRMRGTVGLSSMVVPLYIAEAAPSKDRGLLVTLNVMFITGGQAAAAVLSGALSRKHDGWRYVSLSLSRFTFYLLIYLKSTFLCVCVCATRISKRESAPPGLKM